MPVSFQNELSRLSNTKILLSVLPEALKFRTAKALYNYESVKFNGIDIVTPLQNDGLVCLVNTKDLIGWKIFFFGEYELDTNKILELYLKQDDIVLEAGANIGSETLLISKLASRGTVYCFEPNPYSFERLKINVSINELKNVYSYDYALGESDSQIKFHIYPKGFCNSGMSSKYMETPITHEITVEQKTVDTFISENKITKLDFIKMDIQGAEMDLITGASETLKRFKPTIFTEACEPYNDTKKLYELLVSLGYEVFLIKNLKTEKFNSINEVRDGNWLAISKKS